MTRLLLTVPEAAEALAISRSKLYRDLLTSGKPLAVPTVTHLHAVLRKAYTGAVRFHRPGQLVPVWR